MRRILLPTFLSFFASVAVAQTTGQDNSETKSEPVVGKASHSQPILQSSEKKTALQEEAARVLRFRQSQVARQTTGKVEQVAPNGIQPMELYQAPVGAAETAKNDVSMADYTVAKGDTLYGLSKRYNVTVEDLKQLNSIEGTGISLGQSLKIPAVESQSSVVVKVASTTHSTDDSRVTQTIIEPVPDESVTQLATDPLASRSLIYAVLPNETLFSISQRACVGVSELAAANGLTNVDELVPGQRLNLPEAHCLTK